MRTAAVRTLSGTVSSEAMTIRAVCLCASVAIGGAAVAAVSETPPSSDAVRPLRVPHAGIQPEAAVDSHGVLHLLYLRMLAGSSRTLYLLSRSARDLVNRDTRQILLTWTEGASWARAGTLR